MDRRAFLKSAGLALAFAACSRAPMSPMPTVSGPHRRYGPLQAPDANGIRLPDGFTSRVIATSNDRVPGSRYTWHRAPDGGATFASPDDGWIYVSNSEVSRRGGVGAVRFDAQGEIADAYRILDGTTRNCAGGPTPWGSWLSCEEFAQGRVWECDPQGEREAEARPALGVFKHEAAAVDDRGKRLYLTEDESDGRFYRFTPTLYPSLEQGRLEAMRASEDGSVEWIEIEDPSARRTPTRLQAPASTRFRGGEGCWFDDRTRTVFFTTKGDDRVWAYRPDDERIEVLYDGRRQRGALSGVDNVVVTPAGDVLVAEDGGNMELVLITTDGIVEPLIRVEGHHDSELAGPAFDPSGTRLYVSSQRGGHGDGITYEISGPFVP
ncbi:MAG TPA: alkaline phosphatase PhoX [Actinomycetota bacterium]|nr:alkaline phosphatase PhoX [Actinomycetota bacterium]